MVQQDRLLVSSSTILMQAAERGCPAIARMLIDAGASINACAEVRMGHQSSLKVTREGCRCVQKLNAMTALKCAARGTTEGHAEVLKILIAAGASVEVGVRAAMH